MSESFNVRRDNDELVHELLVAGEVVCTATTCADRLVKIITVTPQRRKGYGTKLLRYVEEMVRREGAKTFDTTDIDSTDSAAVSFFRKNGY